MKLVDYPRFVPNAQYSLAIEAMIDRLKKEPSIVAIYQVGGVSTQGISDIDLLVVFAEGPECHMNPLNGLSNTDRYLFIHNLFGLNETHFMEAQQYLFFHNYTHLWGNEYASVSSYLSNEDIQVVNRQVGLEYMLKMYISMTIERSYNIVKIRNILLLAKAIQFDLGYFGITSGPIVDLLNEIIIWRSEWFKNKPDKEMFIEWNNNFYEELAIILSKILENNPLHVPQWVNLNLARHIHLIPSKSVYYHKNGIVLPNSLGWLGRKYFNLQHRLNTFEFHLPMEKYNIPDALLVRHKFLEKLCGHNAKYFPHFIPVAFGLSIFNNKQNVN